MATQFADWLLAELESRGMTQSELARKGGISQAGIAHVIAGDRKPGPKICKAIARAFSIPEEEVMRRAGLMSSAPKTGGKRVEMLERLAHIAAQLPPREVEFLIDSAQRRLEFEQGRDKPKRENQTKADEESIAGG